MTPEEEFELINVIKGKLTTFFTSNYFMDISTAEELRNLFLNFSNFMKVRKYLENEFDREINEDRQPRIDANQAVIDKRLLQKNHLSEMFPEEE